jgi:hypothetical protein
MKNYRTFKHALQSILSQEQPHETLWGDYRDSMAEEFGNKAFLVADTQETMKGVVEHRQAIKQEAVDRMGLARVFVIDEDVKRLLLMTNAPAELDEELLRLPFDEVFLDVKFTKEDGIDDDVVAGLLVMQPQGTYLSPIKLKDGSEQAVNMWNGMSASYEAKNGMTWINTHVWVYDNEYKQKVAVFRDCRKQHQLFRRFITNFLLFLSQPDVRLVESVVVEGSQNRKVTGTMPSLKTVVRLTLHGELRQYVERLKARGYLREGYSHMFDVRGHWRILDSEYFTLKRGQRLWIKPFPKGEGMYIRKEYRVSKEQDGVGV